MSKSKPTYTEVPKPVSYQEFLRQKEREGRTNNPFIALEGLSDNVPGHQDDLQLYNKDLTNPKNVEKFLNTEEREYLKNFKKIYNEGCDKINAAVDKGGTITKELIHESFATKETEQLFMQTLLLQMALQQTTEQEKEQIRKALAESAKEGEKSGAKKVPINTFSMSFRARQAVVLMGQLTIMLANLPMTLAQGGRTGDPTTTTTTKPATSSSSTSTSSSTTTSSQQNQTSTTPIEVITNATLTVLTTLTTTVTSTTTTSPNATLAVIDDGGEDCSWCPYLGWGALGLAVLSAALWGVSKCRSGAQVNLASMSPAASAGAAQGIHDPHHTVVVIENPWTREDVRTAARTAAAGGYAAAAPAPYRPGAAATPAPAPTPHRPGAAPGAVRLDVTNSGGYRGTDV